MTHDDTRQAPLPAWRHVGPGTAIAHRCDWCDTPRGSLGSKRVRGFFRCGVCVKEDAKPAPGSAAYAAGIR